MRLPKATGYAGGLLLSEKPKINNESYNDFVHTIVFGKTNTLSHQSGTHGP
jgi:hypothetical protein